MSSQENSATATVPSQHFSIQLLDKLNIWHGMVVNFRQWAATAYPERYFIKQTSPTILTSSPLQEGQQTQGLTLCTRVACFGTNEKETGLPLLNLLRVTAVTLRTRSHCLNACRKGKIEADCHNECLQTGQRSNPSISNRSHLMIQNCPSQPHGAWSSEAPQTESLDTCPAA